MEIVEKCMEGNDLLGKVSMGDAEVVFTSYVRNEGRVTIPKSLRDAYNFKEGDLVECKIKRIR